MKIVRAKKKARKPKEVESSESMISEESAGEEPADLPEELTEEPEEETIESEEMEDEVVNDVVDALKKKFGDDAVFYGDEEVRLSEATDWVSLTKDVNDAIGTPGAPAGHITTIYGPEDSGKTTLVCHALADTQKKGGIAVLCLTERKFSYERAEAMGVNMKKVIKIRGKTLEDVFSKIEATVRAIKSSKSNRLVTIAWDSLAGTVSKAELEGEADDQFMAVAAKVCNKNLRRLVQLVADERICFIIINRIYAKMGVMFGKKTTTYGGSGAKYCPSLCISVTKIGKLSRKRKEGKKEIKEVYGIKTLVEIEKNHLAKPFGTCEIHIGPEGVMGEVSSDIEDEDCE